MHNVELQDVIKTKLAELQSIEYRDDITSAFPNFLDSLKTELSPFVNAGLGQRIDVKLNSLINYVMLSDSSFIERTFKTLAHGKFRLNRMANWQKSGKYQADVEEISIKLDALNSIL
jgi:hypothetical protein